MAIPLIDPWPLHRERPRARAFFPGRRSGREMNDNRPEQMHRWKDNAELKSIQGVKREGLWNKSALTGFFLQKDDLDCPDFSIQTAQK
jgi:hypothetical protein